MINNIGRPSSHQLAVKRYKRREHLRKTIQLFLLNLLVWTFVISGFVNILSGKNTFSIANPALAISPEKARTTETTTESGVKTLASEIPSHSPDSIEQLIIQTFGQDADDMLAIAKCESQLNPKALGDEKLAYTENGKQYGTSHGIFQVRLLPGRPSAEELEDAQFNIAYAKQILDRQGKMAWAWCYQHNVLKTI